MNTNGNDAAFSLKKVDGDGYNLGLTKREYFAAMAMQGLLASPHYGSSKDASGIEFIGAASVAIADNVLAALAETEPQQ